MSIIRIRMIRMIISRPSAQQSEPAIEIMSFFTPKTWAFCTDFWEVVRWMMLPAHQPGEPGLVTSVTTTR